jgi:hypothetical protein
MSKDTDDKFALSIAQAKDKLAAGKAFRIRMPCGEPELYLLLRKSAVGRSFSPLQALTPIS